MKLEQSEMDRVKELQRSETEKLYQIGYISRQIRLYESQIEDLRNQQQDLYDDLTELSKQSRELGKELTKRYGEAEIDFESGDINPVK